MKGLIFGAGNIGRGFLGTLLHESGYEVTFVDADAHKVNLLNDRKEYPVRIVSAQGACETIVSRVSAHHVSNEEHIARAIVEADVVLTAVGSGALRHVARSLALGLTRRMHERPSAPVSVVVIACENMLDNSKSLERDLLLHLDENERERIGAEASFPNCVVDRIVPNVKDADPLMVTVEDYFQLAIDAKGLRSPAPLIAGLEVVPGLDAILEQKLCTLNMAHSIVGYFGFQKGVEYVHDAMRESDIRDLLEGALEEASNAICDSHPSISLEHQRAYAKKVVLRFENPYLRDEIVRVARDPLRKLQAQDRLVRPAQNRGVYGSPYLAAGIAAALRFDHGDDREAQALKSHLARLGVAQTLESISGISRNSLLGSEVRAQYLLRGL